MGDERDTLSPNGTAGSGSIVFDIRDYHASPEDAADSAQIAGAEMLNHSHLDPPLPSVYLCSAFGGDAEVRFDVHIVVGENGMLMSLPAGGDEIHQSIFMRDLR